MRGDNRVLPLSERSPVSDLAPEAFDLIRRPEMTQGFNRASFDGCREVGPRITHCLSARILLVTRADGQVLGQTTAILLSRKSELKNAPKASELTS